MCTFVIDRELKTAEKDIKVYKVIQVKSDGFYAPYQGVKYSSNEITSGQSLKLETIGMELYGESHCIIEQGVHSYAHLEDACVYLPWDWITVEATIPKGTKYYKGYDRIDNNAETYVSEKLIIHPDKVRTLD